MLLESSILLAVLMALGCLPITHEANEFCPITIETCAASDRSELLSSRCGAVLSSLTVGRFIDIISFLLPSFATLSRTSQCLVVGAFLKT